MAGEECQGVPALVSASGVGGNFREFPALRRPAVCLSSVSRGEFPQSRHADIFRILSLSFPIFPDFLEYIIFNFRRLCWYYI